MKCQDEVCPNRQRFTRVEIMQSYDEMDYGRLDLVCRSCGTTVRAAAAPCARPMPGRTIPIFWCSGSAATVRALGAAAVSAVDLFAEIIKEHAPENIWQESPLIGYRRLGNTNRGEIGEEFVRRYLTASGIKVANPEPCVENRHADRGQMV